MIDKITKRIEQAIEEKVFPGCVIGIVDKAGKRSVMPFGRYTYETDSPIVQEDTLYDLASLTKLIPTMSLLMVLIDQGKVNLEDSVCDYIPEFENNPDKRNVLVKHVLTFTLDFNAPATSSMKDKSPDEILETILTATLKHPPGVQYKYIDICGILAGIIVTRVSGKNLDDYAQEYFFDPLDMNRTTFRPETFDPRECAPTEIQEWRGGMIQGIVHDEGTYLIQRGGKYLSGKAGLFSTAPDLLNFLEMLLHEGVLNGKHYFSTEMVQKMYTRQIPEINSEMGLGWKIYWQGRIGSACSQNIFSITGFTGTQVAVDPDKGVAIVFLSNRTFPSRPSDGTAINAMRKDISNIICKAY